ncbi:MAG TPA: ATP-dependent zinc metalloprotease FtsH [Candidatus Ornithomonoglobus merdipullorum]|uniref:ATP-dependent zinc metalloprotease FtsH n=1 Tax=Candidatus Ornithomonoglobus merdipullorum TaxID=2840895 RepID=A0A9D1MAZ5_9FIRM|nr:ATP-dependent zinc metalloprotease FtsH [Candidatus Ornithomonoglobus merdipullorum]
MNNNRKNSQGNSPMKNPLLIFLIISIVATIGLNFMISMLSAPDRTEITYDEFLDMIEEGKVDEVVISSDQYTIYGEPTLDRDDIESTGTGLFMLGGMGTDAVDAQIDASRPIYYTGYINDQRLLDKLDEKDVTYSTPVQYSNPILDFILSWILPMVIMYAIVILLMRIVTKRMGGSGGIMGIGQSHVKMYNVENKTGVTFNDVAGQEEAKESLEEIVDFLHNPGKYAAIGAKQPRGALLVGPPGTGKTLLAKAVAGEANVPFFSLSGSEFVEMFVGVGASRVRDLFKQAAAKAPCIIFIDEIDAIGKSRDSQISANDEREQTLNQLLSEMDGFDSSKGLVVLAATNRPEILDKALLRPGRFDRRIIVEKPDLKGREDILKVHIKHVKTDSSIDLHEMALATSGAVGADLANMVNEAALRAVRLGRQLVTQEDLMESVEVIIAGKEKKDRILSPKEKRIVSFHEVGHALATALQKHTQPVHKITIVPRTMGALGYTMQMPEEEEHYLNTRDEILDQITVLLAGRAAEELVFSIQTTGASNDIERATDMARKMITMFGMSERFGLASLESIQNRYLDGRAVSNCSEETKTEIDREVIRTLKERYEAAKKLLADNRDALDEIAEFLIDKETISGEEFMEIFNRVRENRNRSDEAEAHEEPDEGSTADESGKEE